jgi:hypothetical protein
MVDLTNLPSDITPEDFFMDVLFDVLGEVDLPDGMGQERLQFHVTGTDGIDVHIGLDEEDDLTIEEGAAASPPIAITISDADFTNLMAGNLRDRIKAETGGAAIGPRQLRKAFLPDATVQRVKGLSGDIQIRIADPDTDDTIVVTTTLGGGSPSVDSPTCTVSLDVPTVLDIASGRQQPQQLFFQGRVRIDGDMSVVMGLVSALTAP